MTGPRVYLAGPDVFLPQPEAWARKRAAICARHGLAGVSPLDALADEPAAWLHLPLWQRIAWRNEAHIRGSRAVIANLTPFRGPSADVGTVYEVGFARGIGLPVFGYTCEGAGFLERTRRAVPVTPSDDGWRDMDGLLVEHFGLADNLMIEGGLATMIDGGVAGAQGVRLSSDPPDRWRDLSLFERCVEATAAHLLAATNRS